MSYLECGVEESLKEGYAAGCLKPGFDFESFLSEHQRWMSELVDTWPEPAHNHRQARNWRHQARRAA